MEAMSPIEPDSALPVFELPVFELPVFELVDHRGRVVTKADLLGRWTVIWWYVKADTPG
jgi:cytochrome oxidase Cu insertion factor (SCO1/SenC/PrrC family)